MNKSELGKVIVERVMAECHNLAVICQSAREELDIALQIAMILKSDKPRVFTACMFITAEMSELDVQRIRDFMAGTIQDINAGKKTQTVIRQDNLPKPDAE